MNHLGWIWYHDILTGLRLVLGIGTAVLILLKKRDPVSCLGWLLMVALFPLIGSATFVIGGLNPYETLSRRRFTIQRHTRRGIGQGPIPDQIRRENQSVLAQRAYKGFESTTAWVTGLAGRPLFADVPISLLLNSTVTYSEFEQAISNAKTTVMLQFYQIVPDKVGKRFFDLLIEKAQQGVKVYVLFDAMGSNRFRGTEVAALRRAGILVANFLAMHPIKRRFQINWRNHRKLVVCDGQVAFVGGFNIGEKYLEGVDCENPVWQDAHFKIEGQPVGDLERTFCEDWLFATGKAADLGERTETQTPAEASPQNAAAIILSGPADENMTFHNALCSALYEARQRVWIATAYFVPDKQLLEAMRHAVARGVDVRVVIPRRSNHPFTDFCSSSYFADFRAVGIRLYLYKAGMCHAKILLGDDDFILTGSSNLDYRSFFLNFELDLLIRDRSLSTKIEAFLELSMSRSDLMGSMHVRQGGWFGALARRVVRLFSPVM